jgi:hypothetical protein
MARCPHAYFSSVLISSGLGHDINPNPATVLALQQLLT